MESFIDYNHKVAEVTAGPERVGCRWHQAGLQAPADFRATLKAEAFPPDDEQLVPGKHLGIPWALGTSTAAAAWRRRSGSCTFIVTPPLTTFVTGR